jgi:phage baseplate assembly protein gpV
MTTDAITLIKAVTRDQLRAFKTTELGIVTAVYSHETAKDKNNYECDVRLRNSGLELKRVPVCTQRVGSVAIPNVDDMVLVQFLHGDIHAAVITGRLYNDVDRPPEAKPHEFVYISPDSAESGTRRVYVVFPNGNKVLFDDDKFILEMGKTKLSVNNNGDVEVNSHDQNIRLTDQNGENALDIKVQQGQINLQAQTKVVVEAPQIELVENATHPLVLGDQLLQYLTQLAAAYQSHTHPGEMALGVFPVTPAPPVPPLPPATLSLLSTKTKTG